jgi:hypothetical protein
MNAPNAVAATITIKATLNGGLPTFLLNTPKTSSRSRWLVAASSLSLLLKNFPSFVAKAVVVKPRGTLSFLFLFLSLSEFLEREEEDEKRLVIRSRFPYG